MASHVDSTRAPLVRSALVRRLAGIPGLPGGLAVACLAGWIGLFLALLARSWAASWILAVFVFLVSVALALTAYSEWRRLRIDLGRIGEVAGQTSERMAVLSHEIRTPLSLIKGASDLLLEGTPGRLNATQEKFMRTIGENSASLVELAEDLLTQARIDSGMFDLHLNRVDLRALAKSTVEELRTLHRVAIALDCPGAPPRAWVDARLIRQAIINLVNNAVKASPEASTVTVRIVNGPGEVTVSVSDDGSGMGDVERSQLFERFASGHPLRDGTGIGLVITRQIAQMHGGRLYVDTMPDRGTTIIMTLPARIEPVNDDGQRNAAP
ncbi:HAMP domain-containing sensor histidine kinase [Agromyces sp. H66]|uniref:sensor histidine kinase n=1 Tax=Agromyces sp. H66 TaxID=2529859 RepID=UPI00145A5DBC|nr:HAMP domain-containing sensor histidine kinase [Agromyces sp. H66]